MLNTKNIELHSIINVQAYKHDGKLYKQWNTAKVISIRENVVVLTLLNSKVVKKNKTKYVTRDPLIWIFDGSKDWNVSITLKKGKFYFYINIASAPIFEDNTIKYIDYDLDIKYYPGKRPEIVDQNEFKTNSAKYNYSNKLIEIIKEAANEVMEEINAKTYPFDMAKLKLLVNKLIEKKILFKKNKIK